MKIPSINFIGTGKLGNYLAKLIQNQGIGKIAGIYNRSFSTSLQSVAYITEGTPIKRLSDLPSADIIFITTSDDAITSIVEFLYSHHIFAEEQILVHCSGLLSSEILRNPLYPNIRCASLHPMKSFTANYLLPSAADFKGTFCALEGDISAKAVLKELFVKLGAELIEVPADTKPLYHLGGVYALNYLVTLFASARSFLEEAGFNTNSAKDFLHQLMTSKLNELRQANHVSETLSGPIQRGDIKTIAKHLEILEKEKNTDQELYKALAKKTLEFVELDIETKNKIFELFTGSYY